MRPSSAPSTRIACDDFGSRIRPSSARNTAAPCVRPSSAPSVRPSSAPRKPSRPTSAGQRRIPTPTQWWDVLIDERPPCRPISVPPGSRPKQCPQRARPTSARSDTIGQSVSRPARRRRGHEQQSQHHRPPVKSNVEPRSPVCSWLEELCEAHDAIIKPDVVEKLLQLPEEEGAFLVRKAIATRAQHAPRCDLSALLLAAMQNSCDAGSNSNSCAAQLDDADAPEKQTRVKVVHSTLWAKAWKGLERQYTTTARREIAEMAAWASRMECRGFQKDMSPEKVAPDPIAAQGYASDSSYQPDHESDTTDQEASPMPMEEEAQRTANAEMSCWESMPAGIVEARCWEYLQRRHSDILHFRERQAERTGQPLRSPLLDLENYEKPQSEEQKHMRSAKKRVKHASGGVKDKSIALLVAHLLELEKEKANALPVTGNVVKVVQEATPFGQRLASDSPQAAPNENAGVARMSSYNQVAMAKAAATLGNVAMWGQVRSLNKQTTTSW